MSQLATIHCRAQDGIEAPEIQVEVHLAAGLPGMSIVGLPEMAVRESKDRVRAAIQNTGFDFPARRITVNLAPADLPKEGSRFDLAIALGILVASGQISNEKINQYEFQAELALDGRLRPVAGTLTAALAAYQAGRHLMVARGNATEVALLNHEMHLSAEHLLQVAQHLNGIESLEPITFVEPSLNQDKALDMSDVRGQKQAKRALEVAASGGHNLLFLGSPGTGKTMLASRLPSILPLMDESAALEIKAIESIANVGGETDHWRRKRFRSPHHTASAVALVGGGTHPKPGEISLAHHGVLFLDELPEFDRKVLEVLREPLESGKITISRAMNKADFPADFQLIAAMNPCPCGYAGDLNGKCRCTGEQISRYRNRISGPLLDRIDMQLEVPRPSFDELTGKNKQMEEGSDRILKRVKQVQSIQQSRQNCLNAQLSASETESFCVLSGREEQFIRKAMEKLHLSGRAYHRVLRLARTLADMEASTLIQVKHLSEALSYRKLDRGVGHG